MTTDEYRELFHLDISMSTACPETGELKRASMLEQIADAALGVSTRSQREAHREPSRGGGRWRSADPI
jgi:hypothetical protein